AAVISNERWYSLPHTSHLAIAASAVEGPPGAHATSDPRPAPAASLSGVRARRQRDSLPADRTLETAGMPVLACSAPKNTSNSPEQANMRSCRRALALAVLALGAC